MEQPRVRIESATRAQEWLDRDADLLAAGAPVVRVGTFSDESLSVGVGVPSGSPSVRRARHLGIPIVRRSTGGSCVLHRPGDLAFSLVLPRTHPVAGRGFTKGYARLGAGLVEWLDPRKVASHWVPPVGREPELCLLGPRGKVLVVQGRVFGGAAQHVTARTLLHHGTLLSTLERARLADVFHLPLDRLERELTCLNELDLPQPNEGDLADLANSIVTTLAG